MGLALCEPLCDWARAQVDVDLPQPPLTGVDESVRLVFVDHRHLAAVHLDLRLPVVDRGDAFENDQQLDVRVPVETGPLSWCGVDEQHGNTDTSMLLADEVTCDDVFRQLSPIQNSNRHLTRMLVRSALFLKCGPRGRGHEH